MREAYRLNQHCLKGDACLHFLISYIYVGPSQLCDFKIVQEKVIASLHYLRELLTQNYDDSSQA